MSWRPWPAASTRERRCRAGSRRSSASGSRRSARRRPRSSLPRRSSVDRSTSRSVRQASGRSEEETVDAIEELTRRGIVREIPGGGRRLGPLRLRPWPDARRGVRRHEPGAPPAAAPPHGRRAWADQSAVGRDDLARFALIAGHEREAGRPAEAVAAFLEAADRAEAVFANREAIGHLEAALALGHPGRSPRTLGSASFGRVSASTPRPSPRWRRPPRWPSRPNSRRSRSRSGASIGDGATWSRRPATSVRPWRRPS